MDESLRVQIETYLSTGTAYPARVSDSRHLQQLIPPADRRCRSGGRNMVVGLLEIEEYEVADNKK